MYNNFSRYANNVLIYMHVRVLDLMCVSYRINRKFLPMSKKYRSLVLG